MKLEELGGRLRVRFAFIIEPKKKLQKKKILVQKFFVPKKIKFLFFAPNHLKHQNNRFQGGSKIEEGGEVVACMA